MRELTSHKANALNDALTITVRDEPGQGGACHAYRISHQTGVMSEQGFPGLRINFQKGPIAEAGINGISMEALLAIVEDRLIGFQSGEYANQDNATALSHVQAAIYWLHHRTKKRVARGVEGTSAK